MSKRGNPFLKNLQTKKSKQVHVEETVSEDDGDIVLIKKTNKKQEEKPKQVDLTPVAKEQTGMKHNNIIL